MKKMQSGFTLVEIAIVLVIVGLLLGGVLKGQELITQAKIRNVGNDLNGMTAAVYAYQDRFKTLPGDDQGGGRWADITAPGSTAGNGKIDDAAEEKLFWAHLRKAGFIAGDPSSGAPLNAAGGTIEAKAGALGIGGTAICMSNMTAKIAEAIDIQFDDGKPGTGTIRSVVMSTSLSTSAPGQSTTLVDDGSTLYTMCKQL